MTRTSTGTTQVSRTSRSTAASSGHAGRVSKSTLNLSTTKRVERSSVAISESPNLAKDSTAIPGFTPIKAGVTRPSASLGTDPPPLKTVAPNDVDAFFKRPVFQNFRLRPTARSSASVTVDSVSPPFNVGEQFAAYDGEVEPTYQAAGTQTSPDVAETYTSNETAEQAVEQSIEAFQVSGDEGASTEAPLSPLPIDPPSKPRATYPRNMQRLELLVGKVASVNNPEFIPGATNADGTPRANPFYSLMPSAPVWHRNMPGRFPFGETPYTAKVMSDQINRDLKNTHDADEMPRRPGQINYAAGAGPSSFPGRHNRPGTFTSEAPPTTVHKPTDVSPAAPTKPVRKGPRQTHIFRMPWGLPVVDEHDLDKLLEAEETPQTEEISQTSPPPGNKRSAPHEEGEDGDENEGPPQKR